MKVSRRRPGFDWWHRQLSLPCVRAPGHAKSREHNTVVIHGQAAWPRDLAPSIPSTAPLCWMFQRLLLIPQSPGRGNAQDHKGPHQKHVAHALRIKAVAPQKSSVSGCWVFAHHKKFSLLPRTVSSSPNFLFPPINFHLPFKSELV